MTDYNKYSITSVVKDFDEEEMEGRQVRFSLNTLDDVFFLIDDDTGIREDNQALTKYATTDTDGEAGVYVYIESSVESATVNASIDGLNEQIIIFNTGIRVSSVALQTDKNTIYNGNKNENATLTATVTASETYTGVVAFYDGNTLLGTVSAVNNVATFTLESTNHSMVTPTVTRNIRAVAGGVNSNVLEITDYYTYPNLILIRPYYNGRIVAQVPENETWRLQIGLRDNRQAAVPNATGTVRIDGVEQEITLGSDGFWNYNITNGSGTGSVSVAVSFGNLTDYMNVGIVLHDCTDIMFSQASYTADSDGNVTLEVELLNDSVAVPNATVSLSDGVSIYTGITNQNGVATFNLTGLTASASWTCSYSNVSDTCTVTVTSYLFYDSGVTGTKNTNFIFNGTPTYCQVTTDADGTVFLYTRIGSGMYIPNIDISQYANLEISWIFTYGTRYACQTTLLNSNKTSPGDIRWHNAGTSTPTNQWYVPDGSKSITHTLTVGDTMKLVKTNNTFSFYCNDELISTVTPSFTVAYIGFTSADNNRPFGYKELKIAEAL